MGTPTSLTSWTLHLFSSDADVATIKAEPGLVITYRLTGDRDAPPVEPGSTHEELFAFFLQDMTSEPNNVLEPDEVRDLRFSYVAEGPGDAVFTAHLHGAVGVDSLFPRGNGADATGDLTVRRPPSTGNGVPAPGWPAISRSPPDAGKARRSRVTTRNRTAISPSVSDLDIAVPGRATHSTDGGASALRRPASTPAGKGDCEFGSVAG